MNFLHHFWLILVWVNFWQKCKPIALVFAKKRTKFLVKFLPPNLAHNCMGQFLPKMQAYKPYVLAKNESKFLVIFLHHFWLIFVPVNFWQKCKPIALLFAKKGTKFLVKFLAPNLAHYCPSQFLAKMQAYSLTCCQKMGQIFC